MIQFGPLTFNLCYCDFTYYYCKVFTLSFSKTLKITLVSKKTLLFTQLKH